MPNYERRFTDKHVIAPQDVYSVRPDHPAMVENRSLFPSTVVEVTKTEPASLLISGKENRKLGQTIQKGAFKGYALYQFSLEERATCPISCEMRGVCYGNSMQFGRRHRIGDADIFYDRLDAEIGKRIAEHGGLMVRLHVLGDFPSVEYVMFWKEALETHDKLACYGYTHRKPKALGGDEIGDAIAILKETFPDRFRIRWSRAETGPDHATVLDYEPSTNTVDGNVVCPAQTDATGCCSTCGLCWEPAMQAKSILFMKHGRRVNEAVAANVMAAAETATDEQVAVLRDRVEEMDAAAKRDGDWIPEEWELPRRERQILLQLMRRRVCSKEMLVAACWGDDADGGPDAADNTVESHVSQLRARLKPYGITIENERFVGYRLTSPSFAILDAIRKGHADVPGRYDDLGSALAPDLEAEEAERMMKIRPLTPVSLVAPDKPAKITRDRPEIRMVRLADMRIEDAYQRSLTALSIRLIRRIITSWDWDSYNLPTVEEQPDGTYLIVDGQHTAIAAVSHPQIAALPCKLKLPGTMASRAAAFVALNTNKLEMSPFQIFHANVVAGDAECIGIMAAVRAGGGVIPRYQIPKAHAKAGQIMALGRLDAIYRKHGADRLTRVVSIAIRSGVVPASIVLVRAIETVLEVDELARRDDDEIIAAIKAIENFESESRRRGLDEEIPAYRAGGLMIGEKIYEKQVVPVSDAA